MNIELIHDGVVEMTEEFGVQPIPAEGVLVTEGHAIIRIVDITGSLVRLKEYCLVTKDVVFAICMCKDSWVTSCT